MTDSTVRNLKHDGSRRTMRWSNQQTLGSQQPLLLFLAWSLGVALATLPAVSPALTEHQEKKAELQDLRRRIGQLHQRLERARTNQSREQDELRRSEISIGRIARELRAIKARLASTRQRLGELHRQKARLLRELGVQRRALANQLRAAYAMGRQDYLKLLLNQEDPATLERVVTYYNYLNQARTEQIRLVQSQLARLATVRKNISQENETLRSLQAEAMERKSAQEGQRETRAKAIARLRSEIEHGGQELESLKENERELERLLKALREVFDDIPKALDRRKSFPQLRGRLPWPHQGQLRHRFGTSRKQESLKWQGVVIAGREGQTVKAIHYGRVAFADWLRGLGLLIIVDHGDGFMSLYGYNQSLLKETGDWVETGEPIATVGDSGGHSKAGLYFEIRRQGIPLDPTAWCRTG